MGLALLNLQIMYDIKHRNSSFAKFRAKYKYSQTWRQEGWIDRQVAKGRLYKRWGDTLKNIIPIMDAIFPGRWDLQFELKQRWETYYNTYTLVYFDEHSYNTLIDYRTDSRDADRDQALLDYSFVIAYRANDYFDSVYDMPASREFQYAKGIGIVQMFIVIHYPEVTVTNSKKQSLTIRDLFVRFSFNEKGEFIEDLQGTRTTYTLDEFETDYTHSHLPRKKLRSFQTSDGKDMPFRLAYNSFCLGIGEIKDFIGIYNSSRDPIDFESIMYMLNTVVSWESLEGVPHARIANTLAKMSTVPDVPFKECHEVFKLILKMSSHYENFDIDWLYKDGTYEIIDNEKFEDFLRTAYLSATPPKAYTGYKDESDSFYVPTDIKPGAAEITENDFIIFQGQKIFLKIEGELKFSGERKWYINPKIKQYVKSKLECVFNKAQIRESAIAKSNQGVNNTGVPQHS